MHLRPKVRIVLASLPVAVTMLVNHHCVAQTSGGGVNQLRRIGPLIVLSSHAPVDDPERIAHALLQGQPDENLAALQAMGVDSDPSVHELWIHRRAGKDTTPPEQAAKAWISAGVPDLIYGSDPKPYQVIHIGVDDLGDQPFWADSVFKEEADQWYRVATVACLCRGDSLGDIESTASPKRPKVKEMVFIFNTSLGANSIWSDQIVRFRLRNDVLEPVFDKEGNSMNCPSGNEPGKLCTLEMVNLTPSEFVDLTGHKRAGSILMRSEGTTQNLDKMIPLLKPLSCTPYIWDEEKFAYEEADYKAKVCRGVPADTTPTPK